MASAWLGLIPSRAETYQVFLKTVLFQYRTERESCWCTFITRSADLCVDDVYLST